LQLHEPINQTASVIVHAKWRLKQVKASGWYKCKVSAKLSETKKQLNIWRYYFWLKLAWK
jgi:hypothetical protein